MTLEGSRGGEGKRSCFAVLLRTKISIAVLCLQSENKRRSGTGFALELGLSAAPGILLPGEFIPFQVVVLVTVGFFQFFL